MYIILKDKKSFKGDDNIQTTEEIKYYTCKYDRPFKEIFLKEKNKHLLKELLELILNLKIEDIKLSPTERNTGNLKVRRKTYDALLTTNIGKIELEVNGSNESYVHPRNMAYICDLYSHHTLVKENYDEKTMIIQINFSYELSKEKNNIEIYKIQNEKKDLFVKNFEIIEINMEKYVNMWYDYEKERNNKELIEKNQLIIMLGLKKEELEKLSKKYKKVGEFMKELDKINEDPEFREYMTYEEDQRKIFNSRMIEAEEKGLARGMKKGLEKGIEKGIEQEKINIAKNLLNENIDIKIISKTIGLTIDEIKNLK